MFHSKRKGPNLNLILEDVFRHEHYETILLDLNNLIF
jgi:hypothetical protein